MKYLLIAVVLLSGCTTQRPVAYVFEGVNIPEQFDVVPTLPDAPIADKFYSPESVQFMFSDRSRFGCIMYSRYRELLRTCTNGDRVLPAPTEKQCPVDSL